MSWHAYMMQIIKAVLKTEEVEIYSEVEVGKLPLKIDMVVQCKKCIRAERKELKSLIKQIKKWAIVELKFANESLTIGKILKMIAYFALFAESKNLSLKELKEVLPIIITARKPVKVFRESREEGYTIEKLEVKGFYRLNLLIPLMIVVINELPLTEEFLPLLLFARGEKLEETLRFILKTENKLFISWSYILYQKELMKMAKAIGKGLDRISLNVRETIMELGIRNVINDIGLKEVIKEVGLKEVIKAVGAEEIAREIDADVLKKVLKEKEIENN